MSLSSVTETATSRQAALDSGLTVRRRLPMRPVAGSDTESCDPVHPPSAGRAVEHKLPKLPVEVSLQSQEL
jgi:hypothetical protein